MNIAEVYQSGGTPPGGWQLGMRGVTTRYVASLATDANGKVSITVRNINTDVNTKVVTMLPMASATLFADTTTDMGAGLWGWLCGGAGTTIDKKFLPSSCRGT